MQMCMWSSSTSSWLKSFLAEVSASSSLPTSTLQSDLPRCFREHEVGLCCPRDLVVPERMTMGIFNQTLTVAIVITRPWQSQSQMQMFGKELMTKSSATTTSLGNSFSLQWLQMGFHVASMRSCRSDFPKRQN